MRGERRGLPRLLLSIAATMMEHHGVAKRIQIRRDTDFFYKKTPSFDHGRVSRRRFCICVTSTSSLKPFVYPVGGENPLGPQPLRSFVPGSKLVGYGKKT